MIKKVFSLGVLFVGAMQMVTAQEIREYTVKRTDTSPVIDGILDEKAWENAPATQYFVEQEYGDSVPHATQAKMLWDKNFLYIGFICEDPEIWSTYTGRDSHLWEEENVEIFGDPDGDEKNYFEMEFNPLGTIFDQVVDHSWLEGDNHEDRSWNLGGLQVGVSVKGTLNDASDNDTAWYCEVAIPFDSLDARILPGRSAPSPGDTWRLQLARYNRDRDSDGNVSGEPETSLWNMTGSPWFHVPERFGRIIFSGETVTAVVDPIVSGTFRWEIRSNPVSDHAIISFDLEQESRLRIDVYSMTGQKASTFPERIYKAGHHTFQWYPSGLQPGIYFFRIRSGMRQKVKKVLVVK